MSIRNVIGIVLLLGVPCLAQVENGNLIVNGDFEAPLSPGAKPTGWEWFSSDKLSFELTDEEAHSGKQSLKLMAQLQDDGQVGILQTFDVEEGDKYSFRGFVKNSRNEKMKGNIWGALDVEWFDAEGTEILRETGASWNRNISKLTWKEIETKVKVPKGAAQAKFVIRVMDGNPHGTGYCFIDDVIVEKQ
ncbi:MAG: hypothetical protein EOM20_16825 [Spartobacteria bacterium]|nr:hypothetical protein [Spartobacteria bacterium]